MPSKSLNKVHKQISKKRGGKPNILHQNSRDSQRLQRALARDGKISQLKSQKEQALQAHLQRLSFFQESLNQLPSIDTLEYSDILTIVHAYLARNDAEIEELATSRRHGRPPSKRETELKQQKADEERQLQSGFWAPDLRDKDTVEKLRGWKGEWVALGQMKFVRVDGDGKIREGEWPPGKG